MNRVAAVFAASLICFAPSAFAQSATAILTVQVTNVSPKGGDLRISLYDRAGYDARDGKAVVDVVVSAKAPSTEVIFPPVPPGTYAIKMFQDYNKNGEFDFNWIGLPAEGYGFSIVTGPILSEPRFDKTKFDLAPGNNSQTAKMH